VLELDAGLLFELREALDGGRRLDEVPVRRPLLLGATAREPSEMSTNSTSTSKLS
jgi:hypothetical protein